MQDMQFEVDYKGWTALLVLTYIFDRTAKPDSTSDIGWDVISAVHDEEEALPYDGFSFEEKSCTAEFGKAVLEEVQRIHELQSN